MAPLCRRMNAELAVPEDTPGSGFQDAVGRMTCATALQRESEVSDFNPVGSRVIFVIVYQLFIGDMLPRPSDRMGAASQFA